MGHTISPHVSASAGVHVGGITTAANQLNEAILSLVVMLQSRETPFMESITAVRLEAE